MKTIWKIIIGCIALGLILFVIGWILKPTGNIYMDRGGIHASNGEDVQEVNERNMQEFTEINIDVASADIEFIEADDFGLEIYNDTRSPLTWSNKNGRLEVRHKNNMNIGLLDLVITGGDRNRSYVKVYFPADVGFSRIDIGSASGNKNIVDFPELRVDEFMIDSISGNIDVSGIIAGKLNISSTSGRLSLSDVEAKEVAFDCISGNAKITNLKADSLKYDKTSGEGDIIDSNIGSLKLSSISGGISLKNVDSEGLYVDSGSGNFEYQGSIEGDIKIDIISGRVKLELSGSSDDYDKNIESISGTTNIDGQRFQGDINIRNDGKYKINIDSASGNVNISFDRP